MSNKHACEIRPGWVSENCSPSRIASLNPNAAANGTVTAAGPLSLTRPFSASGLAGILPSQGGKESFGSRKSPTPRGIPLTSATSSSGRKLRAAYLIS